MKKLPTLSLASSASPSTSPSPSPSPSQPPSPSPLLASTPLHAHIPPQSPDNSPILAPDSSPLPNTPPPTPPPELHNPPSQTPSKSSFWSSLVTCTFAALDSRSPPSADPPPCPAYQPKGGRSRWNAAVKRAVAIGPMRRFKEHLLGSRWSSPAASKSAIWFLGVCYAICDDGVSDDAASSESCSDFRLDFCSRIWITYRKGFEALEPANLTTDVGWGCMLRSGQMLLAQALVCHRLGRNWRRISSESNSQEYLEILQCFGDSSSQDCPFSIHNILAAGRPYGLVAGSWLGPYALCRSLEALAQSIGDRSRKEKLQSVLPMALYVVSGDADGERGGAPCICVEDVASLCSECGDVPGEWAPVLLLVPLVLGPERVNPRYLLSLWGTFTFPQSLGIAGGKPGASTYLVGVQDDQVFYLDPHDVQQALLVSPDDMDVNTSSYHCSVVKQMPLSDIDPSLALGFYCQNQEDFDDLCKRASELASDSNGAPMFTVMKSSNKGEKKESSLEKQGERVYEGDSANSDVELFPSEEEWQIL